MVVVSTDVVVVDVVIVVDATVVTTLVAIDLSCSDKVELESVSLSIGAENVVL